MKRLRLSALVALVVLLASGCSTLLVDNYRYGTIEVQAWLENGEPAEGLELLLYRNTEHLGYGRTDSEGKHTFTFAPNGSLGVMVELAPHFSTDSGNSSDYRDQIEVPNGQVAHVVFTKLRRTGVAEPVPPASDVITAAEQAGEACGPELIAQTGTGTLPGAADCS